MRQRLQRIHDGLQQSEVVEEAEAAWLVQRLAEKLEAQPALRILAHTPLAAVHHLQV